MDWNQVPTPVRVCCAALWEAGYEACPVGGCIRDTLLGRPPGDWDVASSALPETVVSLFPRTVPTGLRHGTVTVLLGDMSLEVTAFRREGDYADGRHPDAVSFGVGLREDLARRDFTVNAMALRRDGTLADPFGGQADLDAGLIRCVGNPDRRFQEDALRLLRAVRFAAQLDFTLENSTAAALHRNAGRLDLVSGERVKAELEKILLSPRPALAAPPLNWVCSPASEFPPPLWTCAAWRAFPPRPKSAGGDSAGSPAWISRASPWRGASAARCSARRAPSRSSPGVTSMTWACGAARSAGCARPWRPLCWHTPRQIPGRPCWTGQMHSKRA